MEIIAPRSSLNLALQSQIALCEKKYGARFVIEVPQPLKNGGYGAPVTIFYCDEEPTNPEYSRYFGIVSHGGRAYIMNGKWVEDLKINGYLHSEDGFFFNSRHVHDYRIVANGFVDGGMDYFRRSAPTPLGYEEACVVVREGRLTRHEQC